MDMQKRGELKRRMGSNFSFRFSIDTDPIEMNSPGETLALPSPDMSRFGTVASTNSILKVTNMNNDVIVKWNHPLLVNLDFRSSYLQFSVGNPDAFRNKQQFKDLYNSMLVAPWGAIADDGMHHGSNTISCFSKVLKGTFNNRSGRDEMVSLLQEMYDISPENSLAGIPVLVSDLAEKRLEQVDISFRKQLNPFVISKINLSTSDRIHDTLVNAFGYLPFLYQDSRLTNLMVFCCVEVISIFSALLCCRQLSSPLWHMRAVMNLLLSVIEGKLCPSAPTPTVHRLFHFPELTLIIGPLVFSNNFFLEYSYSVTGNNIYSSQKPTLTCMLNMWT